MFSRIKSRLLLAYQALLYAVGALFLCGIISYEAWYSASPYYYEQVTAVLRGDLALSQNPADLKMDLCWSGHGVQQVWGLGIPLWQLPFDVLARIFGYSTFPDRIALGFFIALSSYFVCRVWFRVAAGSDVEKNYYPSTAGAWGAVILLLFFAPLTYLLRSPLDQYGEPLLYLYYFGILLACGVFALAKKPTWGRFGLLCTVAGIGGLIRPTLVFYGFAAVSFAGLIMFSSQRPPSSEEGLKVSRAFKFMRNPRFFVGLFLFVCGGGTLFVTNYLRFGNGWEFGHRLNVSPALPSIYSTRFDYPFKHVSLIAAALELFGALFLTDRFNGVAWYAQGIFPGQSPVLRKRGFDMTTYDLSYAALLAVAWVVGLWLFGKLLRSRAKNRRTNQLTGDLQLPGYLWLIGWSMVVSILLAGFYLRVPVMSDRYMMDFAPAFATSLAGLWWWCTEKIAVRVKHSNLIIVVLLSALISWQGVEIARGKNAFGPPRSITEKELLERSESRPKPPAIPTQYKMGDSMESWRIPYNGEGWISTNGQASCCVIFYVESPEFLDLELEAAPGGDATEASLTTIQAKVGLEFLKRNSITPTNGGWLLRFEGPKRLRYQKGLQPVYLAMVSQEDLTRYVNHPIPWILKCVSWQKPKAVTILNRDAASLPVSDRITQPEGGFKDGV